MGSFIPVSRLEKISNQGVHEKAFIMILSWSYHDLIMNSKFYHKLYHELQFLYHELRNVIMNFIFYHELYHELYHDLPILYHDFIFLMIFLCSVPSLIGIIELALSWIPFCYHDFIMILFFYHDFIMIHIRFIMNFIFLSWIICFIMIHISLSWTLFLYHDFIMTLSWPFSWTPWFEIFSNSVPFFSSVHFVLMSTPEN